MKAALVISDRDNVATALETLEPGRHVSIGEIQLVVRERIPHGHKVALTRVATGQPVIKYGSPIGLATAEIAAAATSTSCPTPLSRASRSRRIPIPAPRSSRTGMPTATLPAPRRQNRCAAPDGFRERTPRVFRLSTP